MSRCRACNAEMTDGELAMTNDQTGEPEDLCFLCLGHAMGAVQEKEEEDDMINMGVTPEEIDRVLEELDPICHSTDDYE